MRQVGDAGADDRRGVADQHRRAGLLFGGQLYLGAGLDVGDGRQRDGSGHVDHLPDHSGRSAPPASPATSTNRQPWPSGADPDRNPHRTTPDWSLLTIAEILRNSRYTDACVMEPLGADAFVAVVADRCVLRHRSRVAPAARRHPRSGNGGLSNKRL
ncbi:hypothetical protein ACQPYE_17845 [Actinosynnema sp. CA-299493]